MTIPAVAFYVAGVTTTASTWTVQVRRVSTADAGATYSVENEVGSMPLSSLADATSFGALIGRIIVFQSGVVGAPVS